MYRNFFNGSVVDIGWECGNNILGMVKSEEKWNKTRIKH